MQLPENERNYFQMRRGTDMVRVRKMINTNDSEREYEDILLMPYSEYAYLLNWKGYGEKTEEYKYHWYSIEYVIDWINYHIRLSSSGGLRQRSTIRPNDSPAQKAIKRGAIWLISIILAAIITVLVERKLG